MSAALHAIVDSPLSVEAAAAAVEAIARPAGEGCGAICTFVGVVRATHRGRAVRHLEYDAHVPLAERVFARIGTEAAARWPGTVLAIRHRIGRIEIGDASVVIAAAAPHRAESFQVCRYAIERIKQVAPVWKHEFLEDGDHWLEGPVADPDNEALRLEALARACA